MAIPAIAAARRVAAEVVVAAPRWGAELYRDLDVTLVPRGEVPEADAGMLLAPSFRAAWEARRLPRRAGLNTDLRRILLTDPVKPLGRHRAEDYAAVARALGAEVDGPPRFTPTAAERAAADVPEGHLALNPLSPTGPPVMWPRYEALADRSGGEVVFYAGPGESIDTAHPVRIGQPLGLLAACLERARVMVSNDSGLAHFARAAGVPVVVIFGSTSPALTGPAGATAVEGPALACRPCYKKRCPYPGVPCLDIPVEQVQAALEALEQRR
jgi:heptosyltransferase-2